MKIKQNVSGWVTKKQNLLIINMKEQIFLVILKNC
jgi:hypothetical protein